MAGLRRALRCTALTFLANMNSLDDPTNWLRGRLPDATHSLLPASLGGPQEVNNTVAVEMFSTFLPGLRHLRVDLVDESSVIIDEEQRVILIHATSTGITDVGPYGNEYIFTLFTTADGTRVRKSIEFVDSALTREILAKYNETVQRESV
jgi:hypothetical protein